MTSSHAVDRRRNTENATIKSEREWERWEADRESREERRESKESLVEI